MEMTSKGEALPRSAHGRYRSYSEYKDSRVEWLGEIPAHWITGAVKHEYDIYLGKMLQTELNMSTDTLLPYFKALHVRWGQINTGDLPVMWASLREICEYSVRKGDLLVCEGGEVGRSAIVQLEPAEKTIIQNSLHRVRSKDASLQYLRYMLESAASEGWLEVLCNKATIRHFTGEKFGALHIALPPVEEQNAVTAFLDRETVKIDALVAKKERLIELLQEQRTALITNAVTKGLDPNVPMKDSGVAWLGKIPAHWGAKRIKWIARMESGHTPDKKIKEYWIDGSIPWVSLNDTSYLKDHDNIGETAYYTNALGIANSSARILPAETVVLSRDATIGRCAITSRPMAVSQHFIAWICKEEVRPDYLLYVLRVMSQELDRVTMGATLKTIGLTDVRRLAAPIPPIEEQQQIMEFVRSSTIKIDALVAKVREAIEHLKEYRTALISAAVTGKIDVRAEVP